MPEQMTALPYQKSASNGFALVIALSLMAFVLLLILSISTLVQVEMASSANSVARLEARQAALLSLNLAIGKLQETAGLDQRVTAPSESVAGATDGIKQVTGVWRSWEGSDHEDNGLPKEPNYPAKLVVGDLDIEPADWDDGRFLGWLVSSEYDAERTTASSASTPPDLKEVVGTTVALLSTGSDASDVDGSVSNEANGVYVTPTEIADGSAAIAWWISGENTKALLRAPEDTSSYDKFDWSERFASSSIPDANMFEITTADNQAKLDRVVGRSNLDDLSDRASDVVPVSADYFHDLTAYSRGLLTNTATGGWRRDISLMSQQWDSLEAPGGGTEDFPFFTLSPGLETQALKNSDDMGGLIYPWAAENTFKTGQSQARPGGASMGWGGLVDFANQYQDIVSGNATGSITFDQQSGNSRDVINRTPVLARIHWILSFESIDSGETDDDGNALYNAVLNLNPVMTYWNPYNVSLSGGDNFWIFLATQLPYDMKFSVGDVEQNEFYTLEDFIVRNGKNVINFEVLADNEVWQPGEARVYSISGRAGPNRYNMSRGYDGGTGFNTTINVNGRSGDVLTGTADDEFTVTLTDASPDSPTDSFTFSLYEWRDAIRVNALDLEHNVPYDNAELYWPEPEIKNTEQTMGDLAAGDPSPFMIMMFQLPNITEYSVSGRGYSEKKPTLTNVSQQQKIGDIDAFPYDVVMRYPNGDDGGSSDNGLPVSGITESDPYGFIGTSYRTDDGLTSLITNEIPTRPLRSLGELQHFDVGAYSPVAPYVANPIGNSSASHLIEPDLVYVNDGTAEPERAGYDHSYVANHLFFDDWFVSSIAPKTSGYSRDVDESTQFVLSGFLAGEGALPNTAYRPAELLSSTAADSAASDLISDSSAWHDVASNLEVDGMFNVNSTSVVAWSAMLRHLRDGEVPYASNTPGASTWEMLLNTGSDDSPVSRTTVAGDPAANILRNAYEPYNEIGTHMRLTDTQIEALATRIVAQVKKRGPFLSLSEFVNRQLNASDESLSLAGAVESALVELSDLGTSAAENPYADLQTTFSDTVTVPSGVTHVFPAAAEGDLAYGFPGWIRQADVLRPLTPVLSARDDTFVIRAYGESKDPITGETQSGVWCEAVVQRCADYVESTADEATVLPSDATLDSVANKRFGRRFNIVSFRWLSPDEV